MSKSDDRRLDAYLAGDVSPEGQRALAQAALDDPELFDQLASAAAVNAAAREAAVVSRRRNTVRLRWMLTGAAAAAAIIVAMVAIDRPNSTRTPDRGAIASGQSPSPTTGKSAASGNAAVQPVILAARLDELAGRPTGEFRTPAETARPSKNRGVVVSIDEGEVATDLGSLDGVTKGSELPVFRGAGDSPIGRLTITTVFRERSRGRAVSPGSVQAGDRVDVPAGLQLNALLEQVLARIAGGDVTTARTLATQGVAVSASVSDANGADTMNELAAVLIRERDYPAAEALLQRARTSATGATAVRVTNNLAALAALRGDLAAAESMYRSALELAGTTAEYESARRAIEQNLQAVRAAR